MRGNEEQRGAETVAETTATATVPKVWMTYGEAEEYCGLERTTLWRAVRDGRLKAGGVKGAPRFHRAELDRFMRGEAE
jgi:excisionase family DNA binding protein